MPNPNRPRVLLIALFALYLMLVSWIILWKLEVPYVGGAAGLPHPWKLIPFVPSGDANASNPLEVLANVVFFVPFGLYLGLLAPTWRWWKHTAVFAGASLVLEVTQHLISVGSFDSTDVVANTAGGAIGLLLARRLFSLEVWQRILLLGALVCVIAVAVFIASPLHYSAPRDVVVR